MSSLAARGRGNSTVCAAFDARLCTSRVRNQKCSAHVDVAEVCAGQRAGRGRAIRSRACGSGATVKTDRDAEFARDVRGGEAADVGHPQVQQVDAARRRAECDGCRGAP